MGDGEAAMQAAVVQESPVPLRLSFINNNLHCAIDIFFIIEVNHLKHDFYIEKFLWQNRILLTM